MVVAATVAAAVAVDDAQEARERGARFPIDPEQAHAEAAERSGCADTDGDHRIRDETPPGELPKLLASLDELERLTRLEFLTGRRETGWHAPRGDRGPRPDDWGRGDARERMQAFQPEGAAAEAVDPATAAPVAASGRSGEAIYSRFCFACHETGVSDAPKFADDKAWAWRLNKGMDGLLETTVNGVDLMPPMGTCMDCSEEELAAAVTYMVHGDRSSAALDARSRQGSGSHLMPSG